MTSIYIFVLSSVYLVEYTLHQNLMIEIHTRNFDVHITVPSPNLAFLCRNLDYKPYSIILSFCFLKYVIMFFTLFRTLQYSKYVFCTLVSMNRFHILCFFLIFCLIYSENNFLYFESLFFFLPCSLAHIPLHNV